MSTATVTVAVDPSAALPAANASYAKTTVTLTDSAGAVQTAELTGAESPPWVAVFSNVAAVAGGTGTVTAQAVDSAGANIGAAVSTTFAEASPPATFPNPTAVTVTLT